jgi:hypothetical protein
LCSHGIDLSTPMAGSITLSEAALSYSLTIDSITITKTPGGAWIKEKTRACIARDYWP